MTKYNVTDGLGEKCTALRNYQYAQPARESARCRSVYLRGPGGQSCAVIGCVSQYGRPVNNISKVQWAEPSTKDGFIPVSRLYTCVYMCTCVCSHVFICTQGWGKEAHNPLFSPLPHTSEEEETPESTAFAGDKLGRRAPALTRHTLFRQSWPTKAGSMEEERWNGQKATNAGGETAREPVCG